MSLIEKVGLLFNIVASVGVIVATHLLAFDLGAYSERRKRDE